MTLAFIALCLTTIVCDLRFRKVPNALIGVGMLLPLLAYIVIGNGFAGTTIAASLAGALLGFCCLLPAYLMRCMGAGDVKFFAVLGLWLGPTPLVFVFVMASLIAASQSLLTLALRGPPVLRGNASPQTQPGPSEGALHGWRFAGRGIPYAAWLAVAALTWLAVGDVWTA